MIIIAFSDKRWKKSVHRINKITKSIIKNILIQHGYLKYVIEIIYANDKLLHELNFEHRGIDSSTNVLSFPHTSNVMSNIDSLGEIFISFDKILHESMKKNVSFYDHYIHILVHGLLHLLGYTHYKKKDRKIMENKEIKILAEMNIQNPYI